MSITLIPFQPIRFRDVNQIDTDCECLGQNFCQKIQKSDATQFQLKSSDFVSNGEFGSDLEGWDVYEAVVGTAAITNESAEDECDGSVIITAGGGSGPYEYSIDYGQTYQSSSTFSDLCSGDYVVIIRDDDGRYGSVEFSIVVNIDCSQYEGATIQDLIDAGITLQELYNCTLSDLQP